MNNLDLKVKISVALILGLMFVLMFGSIWNDSATMDELAHIPAGFSYVTELDYRLNPEHPPLLKALSGLSARIFAKSNFPTDTPYWQNDLNGQWAQGFKFLYESGNDADRIIFWSRLPLILLSLVFGWLIFIWTKNRFGVSTALFTLILFAFSPTVLAHARYVTTDIGAALGFFIGIISFIKFLEIPKWKNIIWAGLALGAALLAKFSLALLVPVYILILVGWVLTRPNLHWHEKFRVGLRMLLKTAVVGFISLVLIWLIYSIFTFNYPPSKQLQDTENILASYGFRPAVNLNLALVKNPLTRPIGHYLLGLLMVGQRTAGGNTAFFLGEVSNQGSYTYFPLLYLFKESLALHILTLVALWFAVKKVNRARGDNQLKLEKIKFWVADHFIEFSFLLFIVIYWAVSIKSILNIGIRHVLPTLPFIYVLVAKQITEWQGSHESVNPRTWFAWLKNIYQIYVKSLAKYVLVFLLMLWFVISSIATFPHFLSYYNALAGGTKNGYKIAVDSNYDWGQDLKRLAQFVEKNKIEKIAVDYFGGGSPKYYLGDKVENWWSARGPAHGWFAISASFQQGAFGKTIQGFTRKPEDSYEWLKPYAPVARIGHSIFLYKLPWFD